jgi:hypothetical protein
MFTRRSWLGLFVAAGIFGYLAFRPGKTARAEETVISYTENNEETAARRFATNQPRHWRQVVVAKH